MWQIILLFFCSQHRIQRESGPQPNSVRVPPRGSALTVRILTPWPMPTTPPQLLPPDVFFPPSLAFLRTLRPSQTEQLAVSAHIKYLIGITQAQFRRNVLTPFKMTFLLSTICPYLAPPGS